MGIRWTPKSLWVIAFLMICEKTHTQLPSVSAEAKSEALLSPSKSNEQRAETANSEAGRKQRRQASYQKWLAKLSPREKSAMWKASRQRVLAKDPGFNKRHEAKRKKDPRRREWKRLDSRKRYAKNPEQHKRCNMAWQRRKYESDPRFRLIVNLRNRQNRALKGSMKAAKSFELLGCDRPTLLKHIESQWLPGMSWENHGSRDGCWEIDHKIPIAAHSLNTLEGQKAAFRYTNLQPIWYEENRKKSSWHDGKLWTRHDHQPSPCTSTA